MVSFTAAVMKPVRLIILMQKLQAHQDVGHAQNVKVKAVTKTHGESVKKKKKMKEMESCQSSFFIFCCMLQFKNKNTHITTV